jgi:hypothetical protein
MMFKCIIVSFTFIIVKCNVVSTFKQNAYFLGCTWKFAFIINIAFLSKLSKIPLPNDVYVFVCPFDYDVHNEYYIPFNLLNLNAKLKL